VILLSGVYGYYQLPSIMGAEVSVLLRVGVALAAVVIALFVAATSSYGAALIGFSKGSRTELKKMVWPTRPEIVQTTLIILVLVVIVALFLWAIDAFVFKAIYNWLLGLEN